MKNKMLFWINLFFCVLSCQGTTPADVPGGEDTPSGGQVKVAVKIMSSNVRNSASDTGSLLWSERRDGWMKMFTGEAPDIAGLQEVSSNEKVADLTGITGYGSYRMDYGRYDGPATEVTKKGKRIDGGTLILWKESSYELLDSGCIWLGEVEDAPHNTPFGGTDTHCRTCIWVKLQNRASGQDVYFFNTHFPHTPKVYDELGNRMWNTETRRQCAKQVLALIKRTVTEGAVVYLTGDFNCSIEDDPAGRNGVRSLQSLTDWFWNAWTDAAKTDGGVSYNGFTDTERSRSATIDYIFYKGADALQYRTLNQKLYGVDFISDHWPIVCTFNE